MFKLKEKIIAIYTKIIWLICTHVSKQVLRGEIRLFWVKKVYMGMFKNNEAFHFMASYAHVCLDFKDQTWLKYVLWSLCSSCKILLKSNKKYKLYASKTS